MKYKQAGKQHTASSLYSKLPETLETKRVKEVTELQSEVSESCCVFPAPHASFGFYLFRVGDVRLCDYTQNSACTVFNTKQQELTYSASS